MNKVILIALTFIPTLHVLKKVCSETRSNLKRVSEFTMVSRWLRQSDAVWLFRLLAG